MHEIGGYLEFERFTGQTFHKDAIALNSGRNCLAYIIKARGLKRIRIPYYLCDCVKDTCESLGVTVTYYHIAPDMKPDKDAFDCGDYEALYLVNYFGQLCDEYIEDVRKRAPQLIVDNVQSFFQAPIDGIDTLYTCRKYFGVSDGAFLYTNAKLEDALDVDVSGKRLSYLIGRLEHSANEYYAQYQDNELAIAGVSIAQMSAFTRNMLRGIDYDSVRKQRACNMEVLDTLLGSSNKLKVNKQDCTFTYPFYIENGIEIKKRLVERKIYVPTLWPNVLVYPIEWIERDFAEDILPLPCDQRYDESDMEDVSNAVLELMMHAN